MSTDEADEDLNDLVSDPEALRAEIRAGVQEGLADTTGLSQLAVLP